MREGERRLVGEQQVLFGGQISHQGRADEGRQPDEDQEQCRDGGEAVLEQEAEKAGVAVLLAVLLIVLVLGAAGSCSGAAASVSELFMATPKP